MNICDLSPEIILNIFEYCDLKTLCILRNCCKLFNEIITKSKVFSKQAIVTNQVSKKYLDRCQIILESHEKWRVSYNWKIGRFKKNLLLKQYVKYIPWLNLNRDELWLSEGQYIKTYKRKKNTIAQVPHLCLRGTSDQDVTKFVNKNGYLLAGVRLGSLWLYSIKDNKIVFDLAKAHTSDVTCVDQNKDIFVTGSRDEYFKIWPLSFMEKKRNPEPSHTIDIGDKIWSIGISPKDTKIAIGSSGYEKITSLHIYDLHRYDLTYSLGKSFMRGAGILDLHFEDDNTLLTCGYDTLLRKWDLRCGKSVQTWMDPHDSAYYCLASDNLYTVICGSNVFGRVVLWDQRKSNYIQMYYTHRVTSSHTSSPVYSMSFDSCMLYAALDSCVASLDFTIKRGKISNYSLAAFQYRNLYIE